MRVRCVSTVFTDSLSWDAISLLLYPFAISVTTSASRSLSSPAGVPVAPTYGLTSAAARVGSRYVPPAATARTAWTSSSAAADPQLRTAIAYADASLLNTTNFSGTPVDSTTLLLKYTYYGDANMDGRINADDFALIDRGFAKHLTGWTNGDFNYDNSVTPADYLLIDRVFAQQSGPLSPSFLAMRESQFGDAYVSQLLASVPEPSSLTCLLAGLAFLTRRRRP